MVKFYKAFVLWVMISTLWGCEKSVPPVMQKFTLGIAQQPTSVLMYVALEQNLFEKYGLNVESKNYPSGKRALEDGLLTHQADIISTAETPLAFVASQHPELRIIASTNNANDTNRICARRDFGIQRAKDLAGKTIASQSQASTHYFLHQFLLEQGISNRDVKFDFMKTEELVPAIVDGRVSVISGREPQISQCQNQLGEKSIVFALNGLYEQYELLVTSQTFSDAHPDVILALLKALWEAEKYAKAHPQETIALTAKQLGIPPEVLAPSFEQFLIRLELPQALLSLLEDEARWGIELNAIQGTVPDFIPLFLLQPLRSLAPERVTIIP